MDNCIEETILRIANSLRPGAEILRGAADKGERGNKASPSHVRSEGRGVMCPTCDDAAGSGMGRRHASNHLLGKDKYTAKTHNTIMLAYTHNSTYW